MLLCCVFHVSKYYLKSGLVMCTYVLIVATSTVQTMGVSQSQGSLLSRTGPWRAGPPEARLDSFSFFGESRTLEQSFGGHSMT